LNTADNHNGSDSQHRPSDQVSANTVHSADVILNILARQRDPAPVVTILTPEALRLRQAPIADCARYDQLRRAG